MPRARWSRRKFLALVAAGTAVAAGSGGALAANPGAPPKKKSSAVKKPAQPPVYATPPPPNATIARGIAQQKEWLASSLDTIRRFDLPPGSEQAFAFRPLVSKRRKS